MEVIFIGDKFYDESQTMITSVYKILHSGGYERTDWGFIQIALEKGESVHIRPATKSEIKYFEKMLKASKESIEEIYKE